MSTRQALFEKASNPDYWRQLNPDLTISQQTDCLPLQLIHLEQDLIAKAGEQLRTEGYFNLDEVFDGSTVDRLASGVKVLHEAGWPTPFAIVYDQYWQLFRALEAFLSSILGSKYKQVPNFWCWYIDNNNLSKGWGLHRDRNSVNTILEDGRTSTLTVWIPLTDATVLNGCIYVVPAHLDPNYPDKLEKFDVPDLRNIRALPAKKGSVLGWTEAILHAGSRSSERASGPRVSISFTYQRGDQNAYETPLFDPLQLPSFNERLGLIAQNVVKYSSHNNFSGDILSVSTRLSNYIPPILVEDGAIHEIIETDKPLSRTVLWPLQQEFFTRRDVRAWEVVPFYATSRMPFCESYAEMVLAFLLDSKHQINLDHPLFIVELGGGTGSFAYRFLNEFLEKLQSFETLKKLKVRYVLTDFTSSIVQKWLDNKHLNKHKDAGNLDFAVFRPEQDNSMQLLHSGVRLTGEDLVNPLVAIANYMFDSIEQDAFRVDRGVLEESRFTVYRDGRDCPLDRPATIEQLKMVERYFEIEGTYYGDPLLDSILDHYRNNLEEASIIFPIGALRVISNLLAFSKRELALFAADKGFDGLSSEQIRGFWPQKFSTHGSLSFDVNFDAIARYFKNNGGFSLTAASNHSGLCTSISIVSRKRQSEFEYLQHYFKSNLARKDLFNSLFDIEELICRAEYPDELKRSRLELFISIVRTYNFEPVVFTIAFHRLLDPMEKDLDQMSDQQRTELLIILKRVAKNIYMYDQKHDSLDCLLRLYVRLKCFEECLDLCQQSLEAFGPLLTILDHFAICYENKGQLDMAHYYFRESVKMSPEHEWARAGVERTKNVVGSLA